MIKSLRALWQRRQTPKTIAQNPNELPEEVPAPADRFVPYPLKLVSDIYQDRHSKLHQQLVIGSDLKANIWVALQEVDPASPALVKQYEPKPLADLQAAEDALADFKKTQEKAGNKLQSDKAGVTELSNLSAAWDVAEASPEDDPTLWADKMPFSSVNAQYGCRSHFYSPSEQSHQRRCLIIKGTALLGYQLQEYAATLDDLRVIDLTPIGTAENFADFETPLMNLLHQEAFFKAAQTKQPSLHRKLAHMPIVQDHAAKFGYVFSQQNQTARVLSDQMVLGSGTFDQRLIKKSFDHFNSRIDHYKNQHRHQIQQEQAQKAAHAKAKNTIDQVNLCIGYPKTSLRKIEKHPILKALKNFEASPQAQSLLGKEILHNERDLNNPEFAHQLAFKIRLNKSITDDAKNAALTALCRRRSAARYSQEFSPQEDKIPDFYLADAKLYAALLTPSSNLSQQHLGVDISPIILTIAQQISPNGPDNHNNIIYNLFQFALSRQCDIKAYLDQPLNTDMQNILCDANDVFSQSILSFFEQQDGLESLFNTHMPQLMDQDHRAHKGSMAKRLCVDLAERQHALPTATLDKLSLFIATAIEQQIFLPPFLPQEAGAALLYHAQKSGLEAPLSKALYRACLGSPEGRLSALSRRHYQSPLKQCWTKLLEPFDAEDVRFLLSNQKLPLHSAQQTPAYQQRLFDFIESQDENVLTDESLDNLVDQKVLTSGHRVQLRGNAKTMLSTPQKAKGFTP